MLGRGMADDGPSARPTIAHDGRWGAEAQRAVGSEARQAIGSEARRAVGSRGTTGGGEPRHDGP